MTTPMLGVVCIGLSVFGLIAYGVKRFFLDLLSPDTEEWIREEFSELR